MKEHQKWYKELEAGYKKRLRPTARWINAHPTRKERRNIVAPRNQTNVPLTKSLVEKYNVYKDFK